MRSPKKGEKGFVSLSTAELCVEAPVVKGGKPFGIVRGLHACVQICAHMQAYICLVSAILS